MDSDGNVKDDFVFDHNNKNYIQAQDRMRLSQQNVVNKFSSHQYNTVQTSAQIVSLQRNSLQYAPTRGMRNSSLAVAGDYDTNSKMPEIAESMISRDEEDDADDFNIDNSRDPSFLRQSDQIVDGMSKLPHIRKRHVSNLMLDKSPPKEDDSDLRDQSKSKQKRNSVAIFYPENRGNSMLNSSGNVDHPSASMGVDSNHSDLNATPERSIDQVKTGNKRIKMNQGNAQGNKQSKNDQLTKVLEQQKDEDSESTNKDLVSGEQNLEILCGQDEPN